MKKSILKTLVLVQCMFVLSIIAQAQLPDFIRVDTGVITAIPGGHISSACFDMDNDGDLDLLISNNGVYIHRHFSIYKNERNGLFVNTPRFVYSGDAKNLRSFGDIDNDGDIDLFASYVTADNLRIYANDGYGNYQLDTSISLAYSTLYPSLLDLNNDGFLDIVGIDKYGSVTFNDGNGGFLENASLGFLHNVPNAYLHSMSWGDPDDDGDLDAYGGYSPSSGDISKNACFLNSGNGTFVKFDETSVIVDDSNAANACVNWVDYDNDGDMDLYVLNHTLDPIDGPLSALYENLGDMQFAKHVFEDEMYRNSHTNSSVWGDLDNDADLDLYVSIENNVFPWGGQTSATPYNLIFLNEGNGQFTNILDHPLAYEDSHTALLFDHDNDGDLDVLLTRYSWSNDGYNNLFINEGNDNSWIVLTCEGTLSNRSAIGTRVYAKVLVNGNHITQTREITPINGHLSYANLRLHFGLGDADVIDTMQIRWPSGHIDEYLNVEANQFYRAIEDSELGIDFKATNYIKYSPAIADLTITEGDSKTIDLKEYYHFIKGDTVPEIAGDTLTFSVYTDNPDAVTATINGSNLSLVAGNVGESSKIQLIASAGFTERMDHFTVEVGYDQVKTPFTEHSLKIYPNPFSNTTTIEYTLKHPTFVQITIYNHLGKQIKVFREKQSQGKQKFTWNTEGLTAGIYYCVLKTGEGIQTTKMMKH